MDVLKRNNVHVMGTSGPTVIFAHGFGCSQKMWSPVAEALAGSCRQVLFDYVGSGQSDLTAFSQSRYGSLQGYAQDLLDVCDALGLQSGVHVAAHSVGCTVAMLASIARPGLFDRLVLVGPSPRFLNEAPNYAGGFERADLEGLLALMDQNYMGWANYLAPIVAGASGEGEVSGELSDSFCSTDPVAARSFAAATFFADNRADLPKVTRPCLILQHARDALAPVSVGEYLHAHLADSELRILDVDGHCAHMSDPQLVVDAMRGYLGLAAP